MEIFPQRFKEGKVTLFLPNSFTSHRTPALSEVFYNPNVKLVRDLSVLVYESFGRNIGGHIRMADAMAGVGVRGLRVAAEAPNVHELHLNDIHDLSIKVARLSAEASGVVKKCSFFRDDACNFLRVHGGRGGRFEIVDLDPYGTPAPYADCALRAVRDGGLVGISATDTAVLCGLYPRIAYRRYGGYSLRTDFSRELGVRLLLSSMVHQGGRMDLGLEPIFCHFIRNHIRVYAKVRHSASLADRNLDSLGYVLDCKACGERSSLKSYETTCGKCGREVLRIAGPLWTGPLHSKEFLSSCISLCDELGKYYRAAKRILEMAHAEENTVGYFDLDHATKKAGLMSLNIARVIEALKEQGYRASRSSMELKGVKTNTPLSEFLALLKDSFHGN